MKVIGLLVPGTIGLCLFWWALIKLLIETNRTELIVPLWGVFFLGGLFFSLFLFLDGLLEGKRIWGK